MVSLIDGFMNRVNVPTEDPGLKDRKKRKAEGEELVSNKKIETIRSLIWANPLVESTFEIPSKEDLNTSKIWYSQTSLGYKAIIGRNDPEELKEFSETMLSLDFLSPEKIPGYALEELQKQAEEHQKSLDTCSNLKRSKSFNKIEEIKEPDLNEFPGEELFFNEANFF